MNSGKLASSLLLCFVCAGFATGCGSSGAPIIATPLPDVSGNWEIVVTPAAGGAPLPEPLADFTGALQSSNGAVTGTLRGFDPSFTSPCVLLTQDLAATGNVDATRTLKLQIPIAGGTAQVQSVLNGSLQTFSPGTLTVTGGSCQVSTEAVSLVQFAPVTGTYAGTLTEQVPSSGAVIQVSAVLTQGLAPNADGLFSLSGTVAVSGGCSATFSFNNKTVSGNGINTLYAVSSPLPVGILRGAIPPTAATVTGSLGLYAPGCLNTYWSGTLTRQ